jgi:hypothetical protein
VQSVVRALDGGIDYSTEVTGEIGNASVGVVKATEVFKQVRISMKKYFNDLNTLKRLEVEQHMSHASVNKLAAVKDEAMEAEKKATKDHLDTDFKDKGAKSVDADVELAASEEKAAAKKKKKKKKKEEEVEIKVYRALPPQDPVLCLPAGVLALQALENPVSFRPTAPPPPDKPFAIRVGDTFVLLEWEQAEFDGVTVSRYDIYMKNDTRLYCDWKLAPNAINIKSGGLYTRFTVNHLPIGIRTEFRVVGYNSVGRSLPSKASVKITPGENLLPVGPEHRWRRLARGGALAVLDHMEHYIKYRNEVLRGFRLLIAFAQKTQGFLRQTAQVRASKVSLSAMAMYPRDESVLSGALLLIGYSALGAGKPADQRGLLRILDMLDKGDLSHLIQKYMFEFGQISHFYQAVYWCLTCGVPLRGVKFETKTKGAIQDTSMDDLFNIFTLKTEDGDEDIVETDGDASYEEEA